MFYSLTLKQGTYPLRGPRKIEIFMVLDPDNVVMQALGILVPIDIVAARLLECLKAFGKHEACGRHHALYRFLLESTSEALLGCQRMCPQDQIQCHQSSGVFLWLDPVLHDGAEALK